MGTKCGQRLEKKKGKAQESVNLNNLGGMT